MLCLELGDETDGYEQADVIRNGKGNVFMGLSKDDSDALWQAVQDRESSLLLPHIPSSCYHVQYIHTLQICKLTQV